MPRRSPPTPLRLHNGPLPARGKPRHTLPSLPRPAFRGPTPTVAAGSGPVPRARMSHTELPALSIPDPSDPSAPYAGFSANASGFSANASAMGFSALTAMESAWSGPSSPTSASSQGSQGGQGGRKRSREFVRGPWDHSGAIHVPFDVGAVLPPPMPAAVNVRGGDEGVRKWVV